MRKISKWSLQFYDCMQKCLNYNLIYKIKRGLGHQDIKRLQYISRAPMEDFNLETENSERRNLLIYLEFYSLYNK